MSIFDRERSEIAKLFSEELELGLYSLSSEATYRVISVDGIPAQHTILISCYNDEVYLPFESRSNTNRLTVTDLDYDVRYGQVVNHANIDMRVLNDGMNAENYNSDIYIPSNTKVSLRDLLIRAYQLGGYGSRHDLLNSNEITEEEARMAVAEAVGALTSNEAEPSMQTDNDAFSHSYRKMGSETITREAASEFIDECSKHPAFIIGGLDMPGDEYGPVGTVAKNEQALEIINTLKQSSVAVSIGHQPQCVKLKQAAIESRTASAKLAEKNASTDCPCGRDER